MIYLFADPLHIPKLACNVLGELKIFVDTEGKNIEWKFITFLHQKQTKFGLKFTNSLSSHHAEYRSSKMNVKHTSKPLNCSVADALKYLLIFGYPSIRDSEGTIKFIGTFNKPFDL